MMQHFDSRSRALGLQARDMNFGVALMLQLRKTLLSHEQLARIFHPVLAERSLQSVHDRAAHSHAEVPRPLAGFCIPEPVVSDAMSAGECHPAVDHGDFAMIAIVEDPDVVPASRMVCRELAACVFELLNDLVTYFLAATRVDENAHLDAGALPLDERGGQALPEDTVLP